MTNGEKFEEIFGLKISCVPDNPCSIVSEDYCIDSSCDKCKLNNFWNKQYRKPKKKENEKCMSDENVKEILTCNIKHIRPDGEFYLFTKEEVEEMKEYLNSKSK